MKGKTHLIADLLPTDPEDAILLRDLCTITGMKPIAVKREVQNERRMGILIGGGRYGGYYLAKSQEQLRGFYRSMEYQATERLKTIRYMKSGGDGR